MSDAWAQKGALIIVDGLRLVGKGGASSEPDFEEAAAQDAALTLKPAIEPILPHFDKLANVYVWCVPQHGTLPQEIRRCLGSCFGPVCQDPAWRIAHVKELGLGIGTSGIRALLAQVADARDVRAMATLAFAVSASTIPGLVNVDEACRFVGGSFDSDNAKAKLAAPQEAVFDEALLACDGDGARLLSAPRELAHGGRVLIFGTPGSGKSAYARVLALRLADFAEGAPAIFIEPATLLTRHWGVTERRISALFQRAQQTNAVLIAEEFDSIATVRDTSAPPSGNAYIIRCLTNEFLRQMDAFPEVVLIATVNDLDALDPAIRRRFSMAVGMRAALSPAQERRAWSSLLGMAPPKGWTPCGACVADVAAAREQCRLTGRRDARSHAAAIQAARATRLGHQGSANTATGRRLH